MIFVRLRDFSYSFIHCFLSTNALDITRETTDSLRIMTNYIFTVIFFFCQREFSSYLHRSGNCLSPSATEFMTGEGMKS